MKKCCTLFNKIGAKNFHKYHLPLFKKGANTYDYIRILYEGS